MKKLLILSLSILTVLTLTGCVDSDKATIILSNEGYSNIEIQGYDLFGCSNDDFYKTKFTATKNNKQISGVVCAGFLKGSTIRLYN